MDAPLLSAGNDSTSFLVEKNRLHTYEYSHLVESFGREFVLGVCEVVRKQRALPTISPKIWRRIWLAPLQLLFDGLHRYRSEIAPSNETVSEMPAERWAEFAVWLGNDIQEQLGSPQSKRTITYALRRLFRALATAKVIPLELSQLQKVGKVGAAVEDVDPTSPFFLFQSRGNYYDFSSFTTDLGHQFVHDCCNVVRQQKTAAGIRLKSWLRQYVGVLGRFFSELHRFTVDAGFQFGPAEVHGPQFWKDFGTYLEKCIQSQSIADSSKRSYRSCVNNLLACLATAKVLPLKIELSDGHPLRRAKVGESRLANPGWNHKIPRPHKPSSPFEFTIVEHRRTYDFSTFLPLGRQFLLKATPELRTYYAKYSPQSAKQVHSHLSSLLAFLLDLRVKGTHAAFFAALSTDTYISIPSTDWELVLDLWKQCLTSAFSTDRPSRQLKTANSKVMDVARILTHLANTKTLPTIDLFGYKSAKALGVSKPHPTLAQLEHGTPNSDETEREVADRICRFFDASDQEQAHDFIRSLCKELSPKVVRGLSVDALIREIHALNANRLADLRACAEADFLEWHAHWKAGQEALAAATIPSDRVVDFLDSPLRSASDRRKNSKRLLLSGREPERLANALNYVLSTRNGISSGLSGRYGHLMKSFGGTHAFHAYLHPHPDATLALWVLLMIDTGANCEVARHVPFPCLQDTNDPGRKQILVGTKAKAGGKLIVDELPVLPEPGQRLSAVQAIAFYEEMSARYRALADQEFRQFLLLNEYKGSVQDLAAFTGRARFLRFIERHPQLAGLGALPSMIRPSVLLSTQHRNDDNVSVAQALADHSSAATTLIHYTGRTPVKLVWIAKIREFLDRFQAVVIITIDGAPQKLGLSDEEVQRLFSDAARTGLGVACRDPMAGVQPGTRAGRTCTRLDCCYDCKMRWVVATTSNVADLILFFDYLVASREDALRQNATLWENRWLPWMVFADVALSKLRQGETAKIYAEADLLAKSLRPTYQPFPLF